ncbi:putative cucumisin [Rosa chinensis]|uniref:Putative cucumisin n=1 Tax=Rosa chinensis TaxID=74649 RepID=A0A2P6SEH2_ROSCH|nr:cucumisin [Rosa chinensis]PRQ57076.1 putative cucumisin [Rosa chinensis]
MALRWFLLLSLISSILLLVHVTHSAARDARKAYIVYMGDKPKNGVPVTPDLHVNILRDVVDNNINNDIAHEALLLHSYKRSFHGFAAMLTKQEAQKLAGMDGVVSVFPSKQMSVKTTKSWNFLEFPETVKRSDLEKDIIIGVIDSGIWPESDSFSDVGFGPPPKKWKGICQGNNNFTCNNKIIGARYYRHLGSFEKEVESPRDSEGHGTHCASVAAGNIVKNTSIKGLGFGNARGGVPSAHIAVYKVCWKDGCSDADMLAAFDDAVADGVDIISISIGSKVPNDYFRNGVAIGAFHATRNGILVLTASGNEGPKKKTVSNFAPWMLSVAATTINRQFITKVQLGNGKIYEGLLPNIYDLRGKFYPLIYGGDAPNTTKGSNASMSRFCSENSLKEDSIRDKIVLCDRGPAGNDDGYGAIQGDATGVILTGVKIAEELVSPLSLPASHIGLEENSHIYKYISETRNPIATIFKSEEINDVLAPYVPSYSSRGPNPMNPNILKPDLAAPGTHILAAYDHQSVGGGSRAKYNLETGTSMACPHVAGVAAYVKSFHSKWSPAAIQSALITTAKPMSTKTSPHAEFAYGAGLLNPSRAPYPGLVYDLDEQDYLYFLCSQGYSGKLLEIITRDKSSCSSKSNNETTNDLNYPSFALSIKDPEFINGVFHRTVTNVGSSNSTYRAKVVAPSGLEINVNPSVLSFTSLGQKESFVVTVKGSIEKSNIVSASLVWDDGTFQVRSPIVIHVTV